ncbi:MAG: ATP-binding protein [Bacteroidota bacterium]|jgi:signal transduction histidine kinase
MDQMIFNSQILEELFPFFIVIEQDLSITLAGKSLRKIIAEAISFEDTFAFIRPKLGIEYKFDSILKFKDQVFILQIRNLTHPINLKGQFVFDSHNNRLLFCGSPWITSDDDFVKTNLFISDFALHDSVLDLLQVTSSLRMEFNDKIILNSEIEKQKKFYENLFDNIPVDIGVFDNELRYKFLNKNSVKDDKIRKWLINKTLKDYYEFRGLDLQLADERQSLLQKAITEKNAVRYQDVYNEFDDNEKVILRELFPYEDNEGRNFLMAYGVDITELKKGRDELIIKNKELEKLNGELDSLAYSITHDLRSPVLALMGLLDIIYESGEFGSENKEYLTLMRKSILRLDDTIREILNYYRNARTEIDYTEINLLHLVNQSFESVQYYVSYEINLETSIHIDSPFYSDENRIITLINNLIANAVKYSRENDGNAFIKFSAKIDYENCLITIEDNGEGIPYDHQKNVFKIFHRASSTTSGSGLGLFICSEIINKLNGKISLESIPLQGTKFTIAIPNGIKTKELS